MQGREGKGRRNTVRVKEGQGWGGRSEGSGKEGGGGGGPAEEYTHSKWLQEIAIESRFPPLGRPVSPRAG